MIETGPLSVGTLPTGPRGRLLAVGIGLVALGVLWLAVVSPLVDLYADGQAELEAKRTLLHHMTDAAAAAPRLQQLLTARAAAGQLGLSDGSDAIAASDLLDQLGQMAGEAGLQVASSEVLPAAPGNGFRLIRIRLTIHAAWKPLVRLMQAIETQQPGLVMDDVQLHASAGSNDAPDTIDATLTVGGFRATGAAPSGDLSRDSG